MIANTKLVNYLLTCKCLNQMSTRKVQCYSGESASYSSTGAIHSKPITTNQGLIKILCTIVSSIYLGSWISRSGAEFLEDNEIFVPDDD
ncbi:unnamed protein product [Heterobilharzia americana]|nr:unnamed protein product [Heterobilharzia americana]